MNLPTVEFLKGQADRLITYLGDKHRFRLKPASALEALAALYQQPDWNTLQARAAAAGRAQPAPNGEAPTCYPLDWGQYGEMYHVPRADWQRHVLALGGDSNARRAWMQRHLAGQLERGGTGVFINLFGGKLSATEREQLEADVHVLDLANGRAPGCNLLAGLPPGQAAEVLMSALEERWPEPFWRARVHSALTTLLLVLAAAGKPMTLKRVCTELRQLAEDGGEALVNSCPEGILTHAVALSLRDSLKGLHNETGAIRVLFIETARVMEDWLQQPGLPLLFAEHTNAPGLLELMSGSRCLVIEMAEQDSPRRMRVQGTLLQGVARYAVSLSVGLPREARGMHPRLLALAEGFAYLAPCLGQPVLEQGRVAGWTLLLSAPDEHHLRKSMAGYAGAALLENVWNRMYLDGLTEEALENVLARLARARSVVVSAGHLQFRE